MTWFNFTCTHFLDMLDNWCIVANRLISIPSCRTYRRHPPAIVTVTFIRVSKNRTRFAVVQLSHTCSYNTVTLSVGG